MKYSNSIHAGTTGSAIRAERNHVTNASKKGKKLWPARMFRAPNPFAFRNAIWKYKHGLA